MTASETIDIGELLGEEFDFYGANGNCFKLDDTVYEVIEGENRLDKIRICHDKHGFHEVPIARVTVDGVGFVDEDVYGLVDLHDEHLWLQFGTEVRDTSERSFDTWYVFEYFPKIGAD